MKIMKKVLAGALSLAVVVGACFAFTGCNSVKNKTYAFDSMTYTIVKAVDEKGKITETLTLSFREYYIYDRLDKGMDYATYTMTADEETTFAEIKKSMEESMAKTRIEFGKDTVDMIDDEVDKISGEIDRDVTTGKYEVKDDKITITSTESYDENTLDATYTVQTLYVVDGKVEMRQYGVSEEENNAVGDLYYTSIFFAKTK